ncbi:hypothetical protein SAMN02787118_13855 [Streptomyces mirabilis]|uniref:Uncharacterized protein n=1 Tax=Streptomyces mirabilis TaxID=68239 RepID=A0A1I2WLQ1_9ACTN|nr:hypothetical protein SAMN02787118_13817 [Streptomyces mirabilis]SFH02303.1 hypothetical protein SAMN02787118_13855 [Streptomyces mirabilis]
MAGSAKPCGFAGERWLASPYRPSCGVWPAGSSSIPSTRGRCRRCCGRGSGPLRRRRPGPRSRPGRRAAAHRAGGRRRWPAGLEPGRGEQEGKGDAAPGQEQVEEDADARVDADGEDVTEGAETMSDGPSADRGVGTGEADAGDDHGAARDDAASSAESGFGGPRELVLGELFRSGLCVRVPSCGAVRDVLFGPDAFAVVVVAGAPAFGEGGDELQAAAALVGVGGVADAGGAEAAVVDLAGQRAAA